MKYFISKRIRSIFLGTLTVLLVLLFFPSVILYKNVPQKALAATYYWKGGAAGDANNWSNADNWSATSGGAGGAGIPGVGDAAIFNSATSSVNCSLTSSVQVASITNLNTGGYSQTLAISSYTLTISGNLAWNRGTLSATTGNLIVSGNVEFAGGTYTYGSSTVTLNGSSKTFNPGNQSFYYLVIDGTIVMANSPATIRNTLTINSSKSLTTTGANKTSFISGAILANSGTISGPGILEFVDSTNSSISGAGAINTPVDFRTSTTNITVPARTYGGRVEIVNYTNSNYTATLGSAAGQTITCGGFAVSNYELPYYQGGGNITVYGDTYNPNMVINGSLKVGGTGAGTRTLSMGSGSWTVGGSFNVDGGTLTNKNGTISLSGSQSYSWSSLGLGINSDVYSMVEWDNKLVIGTDWMTVAGGISAHGVAVWDGYSWSALGDGIEGDVYSLAVYNGDLIAAGYLEGSGVVTMYGPLRWTGSSWVELGTWAWQYDITAMIVFNGNLIVGGDFDEAGGGVAADGVASWNGSTWSAVGSGLIPSAYNSTVNAFAIYNSQLVAAGSFNIAAGSVADYIAYYSGGTWHNMGSDAGVYQYIDDLLVDGSNLYAAGNYGVAGSVEPLSVWNGASWALVGSGQLMNDGLTLTKFNGSIYLGGYITGTTSTPNNVIGIAKLNGSTWESVESGADGHIESLLEFNDELYAGGTSNRIGSASATFIGRYSHPYLSVDSNTLNDLTLSNSDTPVTFSDDLTVTDTFTNNTPGSDLIFHDGSTYDFANIEINGGDDGKVTLESTTEGSAWNFVVNESAPEVTYVEVSDSNASGGSEILANDGTSTNGGGNTNWDFGSSPTPTPTPTPSNNTDATVPGSSIITTLPATGSSRN